MLVACQKTPKTSRTFTPQGKESYSLAVNAGSVVKTKEYVPVPMPGQLMPLKQIASSKKLVGEAAIEAANKKAVKQPTSGEYINSIMTFDYMKGALYQIYSAPLSVTDIQFQDGENVISVGAGDTLRWQVSKTHSGSGTNRQEHLLIKPIEDGLTNSLVVTTNLRTYHLVLHSTPKTYMASVTWRYPESDDLVKNYEDSDDSIASIVSGVDVDKLNFNYQTRLVKGQMPDWYPRMVFNDGSKTYVKFASNTQNAPTLFVGDKKKNQIVNYRAHGNYYIVDTVIYQAQLRGGIDNKTFVEIKMKR